MRRYLGQHGGVPVGHGEHDGGRVEHGGDGADGFGDAPHRRGRAVSVDAHLPRVLVVATVQRPAQDEAGDDGAGDGDEGGRGRSH